MLENVAHSFLQYLKFTDGLSASDVVGWTLTFVAGIVVFKFIDNMQTSMERHNMLATIEDGFSCLYDMVVAIHLPDKKVVLDSKNAQDYAVMVRSVLHDDCNWEVIKDKDGIIEYRILNNQRYIHIRNTEVNGKYYNEWISTQALHEITLKARRIEKMYKSGIIQRIDLADLFRELLPLGRSGRIEFLAAYYGKYDVDCIAYLVMQCVVSCAKYHNQDFVKYFADYYNDKAHLDIHQYFEKGSRIRPVLDYFAVQKFKKLMKEYT